MTETLPAQPSPDVNIVRKKKPNLKVSQYGDGYSQRNSFGQNQVALSVTLTYTNISTAEKETLEDFVNAHDRGQAFLWAMPDEATARQWYFADWDVTYVKYGLYTVALSMKECFDIL